MGGEWVRATISDEICAVPSTACDGRKVGETNMFASSLTFQSCCLSGSLQFSDSLSFHPAPTAVT